MLETVYLLIILQIIALLWSSLFFIPAKWIRWGWLWYGQILVTEWVFLSLIGAVLLPIYHLSFIWFPVAVLVYIAQRPESSFFAALGHSLTANIYPFRSAPSSTPWGNHLKFAYPQYKRVCIHIHGGAWKHGDAHQLTSIASFFHERETEVLSINYKKFPEAHLEQIIDSVDATFQEIRASYGPDQKFVLYGRSAGGHLVLMLAARYPYLIERVISLYPVTDLTRLEQTASDHDLLETPSWIRSVVGASSNEKPELFHKLSPRDVMKSPLPPVLLVHGENDPVVTIEQSDVLYKTLQEQRATVTYLRFKKGTHGFDALWNGPTMHHFRKTLVSFLHY